MVSDEEVLAEERESRVRTMQYTLAAVVDAALKYEAETHRCDGAHRARLRLREETLRKAIMHAYEAMNPGPITAASMAITRHLMEMEVP